MTTDPSPRPPPRPSSPADGEGAWALALDDLLLPVTCGGARHHLRWRAGRVEMIDHPEPEAELALVALGGDEPACVGLLTLWDDAVADGGFLEEWLDESHLDRSRLSWLTTALERLRSEGFHEFLRHLPPRRAERMGRFLATYPRPWVDRGAAAVAQAVVAGPGVLDERAPALVPAAISLRLRPAFAATAGPGAQLSLGAAALVPLSVSVGPHPVAVEGRATGPGRRVALSVRPDWLHRVWAPGAAVVDRHLVLDLGDIRPDADGLTAEGLVVTWTDRVPALRPRSLIQRDGTWALVDDGPTAGDR